MQSVVGRHHFYQSFIKHAPSLYFLPVMYYFSCQLLSSLFRHTRRHLKNGIEGFDEKKKKERCFIYFKSIKNQIVWLFLFVFL